MNFETIIQITLAVIVSAGGIGGIIIAVVKFSAGLIAERMNKKFESTLNKEIEKYKSELGRKEYISKARFDTEFGIYRELSKAFFDLVLDIDTLVPAGYNERPADKEAYEKFLEDAWHAATKSLQTAQETIVQNAPFIPEDMYNDYQELVRLSRLQIGAYTKRFNVLYLAAKEEKESYTREDYSRAREIQEKYAALNKKVRNYLASLDVSE